ncbi:N-acetylmuramoyl-L-alanine amidase [Promicromonospora panici]|uniref:N-acetylmuramoyl-L-alanine amidase n=1 Tax=Promicromonospora panici TaxID=2219658 RepID=UPI00101BD24B|nr:N-acetylmuramoyl-L-alanine amidase [Promicromonospora panici]
MARHAAAQASRSKLGASVARTVVGRTIILGVAPAIVLGGALAPTATAETLAPALEPEGTSAVPNATDSALPETGTAEATVDVLEVAAAPEAGSEPVEDVTATEPEPSAETGEVADGEIVLDTTDAEGRIAGTVEAPGGFQTVGASWPAPIDGLVPELQVRARALNGTWGPWAVLEKAPQGADEGSAVMASDPAYLGEADAVQLATVDETKAVPEGVELSLVSSEATTMSAASTSGEVAPASATDGPTIITREEWGAAPQCADPGSGPTWFPAEGGLKGATVHHTVNPNDYSTVAEAMRAIRNDQAYHQHTNGWCDIGYNFLVDKWGNIYEGADGSIEEPIIGAHAGGFNTGTVGIAMLGTFTTEAGVTPSAAQQDGVAHIAGYRLAEYDINPDESATFTAASSGGRFAAGQQVTLPRIFGHRDTHYTECPGTLAYPLLPGIRDKAALYAEQYNATVEEKHVNVVQAVYMDSLGRAATASEIDFWAEKVEDRGTGPLADAIEVSTKYRSARIVSAYEGTLGYTPSSSAISTHLEAIKKGTRVIDEVELFLLGNPKYYSRVGGTDNAYVTALYRHILHRSPTASQLQHWTDRLPTLGRAGVANSLWKNPQAVRLRIAAAYQHYLGVAPTASQVDFWEAKLANHAGLSEAPLRRGLIVSGKYTARADALY